MQDRASDFKFLNFLGFHYLHRKIPFPSYINLVVIVVNIGTARKKDLFTGGHFGGVTDLVFGNLVLLFMGIMILKE